MARLLVALALAGCVSSEDPCVKKNTTYYDDSKPPVAVKYMANAIACQAACEANAPCEAWTYLSDAGSCWQLPASDQMMLVGNPHGESGTKLCRPRGKAAQKVLWKPVWPGGGVALTAKDYVPPEAVEAEVVAAVATPPPLPEDLGAEPLAEGGPARPACATRMKALNDPLVQTLNGGFVNEATECQSRCSTAPYCAFWTFYNDTGGCWLQGSNVTSFPNISAISGPKLCSEAEKASRYAAGHNISGSDQTVMMRSIVRPKCSNRGKAYRDPAVRAPNAYLENADMCQDLCVRTFLCSRFTYYIDSKACWLQGSVNVTEFESPMAIAGPEACAEPVSLKEMQLDAVLNCAKSKVAREGDDLVAPEFMVKSDAVECQAGCQSTDDCVYFTFYALSHRCTLHGKKAVSVPYPDSISGPKECKDDVALPLGAWEAARGRTSWLTWRSPPDTALVVLVGSSCLLVFAALVCRKSQVHGGPETYRHLRRTTQQETSLDEDRFDERLVEVP